MTPEIFKNTLIIGCGSFIGRAARYLISNSNSISISISISIYIYISVIAGIALVAVGYMLIK